MNQRGFSALILILLLAAFGVAALYFAHPNAASAPTTEQTVSTTSPAVLMQLVYGNYDPKTETSLWTLSAKEATWIKDAETNGTYNGSNVAIRDTEGSVIPVAFLTGQQQGDTYYFLAGTEPPVDYEGVTHVSAGIVGAFVLKKEGSNWKLVSARKAAALAGVYGSVEGEWFTVQLSKTQIGFEYNTGDIGQGIEYGWATIYTFIGGNLYEVFSANLDEDNKGNEDPQYSYQSTLSFVPNSMYKLDDIKLVFKGTQPNATYTSIIPKNETHLYHFDSKTNTYIEAK